MYSSNILVVVVVVSANLNLVPIIKYISEDIVSQILIENTNKQSFYTKFIIDTFKVLQIIANAFNKVY